MATWDDRRGVLSFDQEGDLVYNLLDVLKEIDHLIDLGQITACQAIARQARKLALKELP